MVDTVVLTIPKNKLIKLDNSDGRFPDWIPQSKTNNYEKWIKNMPKRKNENAPYYPRLTGYKRKDGKSLVSLVNIEFSVPKLIYLNNLDEVQEEQSQLVIKTLKDRLAEMGEIIEINELENSSVSVFHPSKNIVLHDGYRACGVIKEISKINLTKKLELTKVNFKNGGNALQMYAINHSIVFYDKIADLNQNNKKAVDTDQTFVQRSLFNEIRTTQPKLEILRMEVRLCKKQKLNSVMRFLGLKENPVFKDIFKKDVCQKVVRWYWDTIIKGENLFIFELENTPSKLLADIIRKKPKIRFNNALTLVALNILCKECGVRELRDISEKHIKKRNWFPISQKFKLLNEITEGKPLHSWVKHIDDSLENFVAYRISNNSP